MKPVISLIEALNAVKNNLTSLNEQKEKLSRRIGDINGEITALQDMPLSLNDYCSFIPEYIERFGQEEYQSFKRAIFPVCSVWWGWEETSPRLIPGWR